MQKFAALNASRMAALAAAGKVVPFFKTGFFSPRHFVDLPLDFRMFPAWHRLLRAHMLLRSLVRHIVLLHMHPTDSLLLSLL